MTQVEIGKIKLTGWRAVPVVVAVLAFVIWRNFVATSTVHAEALSDLKWQLLGEYTSENLAPLKEALAKGDHSAARKHAEFVTRLEKITFPSVKSRGTGEKRILRVEVEVDGEDPPDGQRVRYFHASHSMVTGWRIKGRAYAWNYYLKLF